MTRRYGFFIASIILGLLFIRFFTFSGTVTDTGNSFDESFRSQYGIYALTIPDQLNFAGETVPTDQISIRERLDRELLVNTYWQSSTLLFFKRANRWFPVIEPILAKHGVPDDFKYLALIESGLINAVSPAGATGFWQILQGTGRDLGLEVNDFVDERYHVEKSTAAACKYLLDAKERYGSWTMAAAAYNIGNSRLQRIINNQRTDNYYDLFLNEETSRYMFRILAVKTIFEDPQAMGFHFRAEDLYPPQTYYTVLVDTPISDLVDFAFTHNTSYKKLRELNPWLRTYELPNPRGKTYEIKLPVN
ncbi:MAG: lytic transglycosylase domain-containing protein [Bacteroidia bacterium]|nr:MAG: lytic transglycosylase domain-containing protein [Bacteroidia bacterium]